MNTLAALFFLVLAALCLMRLPFLGTLLRRAGKGLLRRGGGRLTRRRERTEGTRRIGPGRRYHAP